MASQRIDIDHALSAQREKVFQVMGIVGLASERARRGAEVTLSLAAAADIWTGLEAAYGLLNGVAGQLESAEVLTAPQIAEADYGPRV